MMNNNKSKTDSFNKERVNAFMDYINETFGQTYYSYLIEEVFEEQQKLNDIRTKYLVDGIKYLYKNDIKEFKLNNIYLMLSKKYNKSLNTIQGDITTATKKMRKHCNKKVILEYFNYLELIKMPTIREIISVVNENI